MKCSEVVGDENSDKETGADDDSDDDKDSDWVRSDDDDEDVDSEQTDEEEAVNVVIDATENRKNEDRPSVVQAGRSRNRSR